MKGTWGAGEIKKSFREEVTFELGLKDLIHTCQVDRIREACIQEKGNNINKEKKKKNQEKQLGSKWG